MAVPTLFKHGRRTGDREDDSDAAIVARARRDPRAFAPLYERHVDAIFRFCAIRLGDRAEAEDATAAVFAQALAALPAFEDRDDSFRRWLFAIARNVVTTTYRQRRDHRPLDDAWAVPDGDPSPESSAIAAVEAARLHAALLLLPSAQRQVIELRLAGLTGPEIAEVLERSHGAVKMLQSRALATLRQLLSPAENPGGDR
jgi:RNA polymerase sigma-70 factor (ECF subfamily)